MDKRDHRLERPLSDVEEKNEKIDKMKRGGILNEKEDRTF